MSAVCSYKKLLVLTRLTQKYLRRLGGKIDWVASTVIAISTRRKKRRDWINPWDYPFVIAVIKKLIARSIQTMKQLVCDDIDELMYFSR